MQIILTLLDIFVCLYIQNDEGKYRTKGNDVAITTILYIRLQYNKGPQQPGNTSHFEMFDASNVCSVQMNIMGMYVGMDRRIGMLKI